MKRLELDSYTWTGRDRERLCKDYQALRETGEMRERKRRKGRVEKMDEVTIRSVTVTKHGAENKKTIREAGK